MTTQKKVESLKPSMFGLAQHKYQTHSATVPGGLSREDLTKPELWALNRARIRTHDEIRVVAEDSSFYAKLLVTYADSREVYTAVVEYQELDAPDMEELTQAQQRYITKLCGPLKWCVIDTETDEKVRTGIDKRSLAERELEDFLRAKAL
ncbi:hypothetical protein [Litorivivens sp.]|uniref:hypothetical protein n=1 Tax=Litorivivens sp. TaxID=2020868 RepID=UPI0035654D0E